MKQITIRGVDPDLQARLREAARQRGQSLNRTVLGMLREATGAARETGKPTEHHDLDWFFGALSREQYDRFMESYKDIHKVDEEMWK